MFATVLLVFGGSAAARSDARPKNLSSPTISGTPQEGQTLTGTTGSWECNPGPCTFAFKWQRCNANGVDCGLLPGATSQTYVPGPADVGFRLQVGVSATNIDCNEPGTVCAPSTGEAVSPLTAIITIKPGVAPAVTAAPTISGTAQQGETLTGSASFSGEAPLAIDMQWSRCDRAGQSCAAIAGTNRDRYVVSSLDVGNTLRLSATARNRGGSASATSAPTPIVRPMSPSADKRSITIAEVELPYRLLIDKVQVSPSVLRSRAPFTVRVHISEARGFWVSGALVSVMAVPPEQVARAPERRTGADGWVAFALRPTAALQLRAGGSLYLYVQTRKPGESALTGVSNSRLVKVRVAAG